MSLDSNLISIISQYTQEKLTTMLYSKGLLLSGKVIDVQKKIKQVTFVSYIIDINLKFSNDSSPVCCNRLILKTSKSDIENIDNKREVSFYNNITRQMGTSPIPLLVDASYDQKTKTSCILMENLDQSHFDLHLNYPLIPSVKQCEKVIEKLAEFHSFWWNHNMLNHDGFKNTKEMKVNKESVITIYDLFSSNMKEWFNGSIKCTYDYIISNLDLILHEDETDYTIIHGDAHFGNVLYPVNSKEQVIFVDWADWKIGKAMDDLAYMIALRYFPEQRKHIEYKMIELHNKILISRGIQYPLEVSIYDYKKAVIKSMLIPILQWEYGLPLEIWYYNMERITRAFEDLKCIELI